MYLVHGSQKSTVLLFMMQQGSLSLQGGQNQHSGWAEPAFRVGKTSIQVPYGTRLLSLGPVFILILHQTVTSSSNLKSEDPGHKTFTPRAACRPRKEKLPFVVSVGQIQST